LIATHHVPRQCQQMPLDRDATLSLCQHKSAHKMSQVINDNILNILLGTLLRIMSQRLQRKVCLNFELYVNVTMKLRQTTIGLNTIIQRGQSLSQEGRDNANTL